MKRTLLLAAALLALIAAVLIPVLRPAAAQGSDPLSAAVTLLVPQVLRTIPHDTTAYTEGLLFYRGRLFESTGLTGGSTLREVDPDTGAVLRSLDLAPESYGEGLAEVNGQLIQLTWTEHTAFVYDLETFEQVGTLAYEGEGWGLCYDAGTDRIYMSNGSPFLYLRDPQDFSVIFAGLVTVQGQYVRRVNELECVEDRIYANVWHTDYILVLDKLNATATAVIDASGLITEEERAALTRQSSDNVLNGIAYNPDSGTFYLTGKRWPLMYEVNFVPQEQE